MKGVGTGRFMCVEPVTRLILFCLLFHFHVHLHSLRALLSFPLTRQCFAVRSLGWVEVPEEDLVPGKSSIAVNNCIQQLAQMHSRSRSQPPDGAWGEVSWLGLQGIRPRAQQRQLLLNCLFSVATTFI